MTRIGIAVALLATRVVAPGPSDAQEAQYVEVDRILAVVGTVPITASRIQEEIQLYRSQGGEVPTDSAGLRAFEKNVLEQLISNEILVQAALRDTAVKVTDQEVQAATDQAMREIRDQFLSSLDYERQLREAGFGSSEEYRLWLQEQKRRELLRGMLLQVAQQRGELTPLAPTERELRAYFEETRGQRDQRPARVTFRQIVVRPQPDSAAEIAALLRVDSLYDLLDDGADFATLAQQASDDEGSRERGGELGWVRRGVLVPEFENVAFRLRPGPVSPPVRSPFGYHLIKVDRSEPAEVFVRHILVSPEITDADIAAARTKAEELRELIRRGVSFDSLLREHHDRLEESLADGFPRDQLPEAYQATLEGAEPGDVLGPIELPGQEVSVKFAVLLFLESRAAGEVTFEELRDQIRSAVAEEKAMGSYLEALRARTYVDVRD